MAKGQWEEEAIQRFIEFLSRTRGEAYGVIGRDVPVATGENFDYRLGVP